MAKKEFKAGLYAVIAGVVVAIVLVLLTIFAFVTRYTAFNPEKVAQNYVDTIVQSGDGYNAYKSTLVSKNHKYGDFIIDAYMMPYINDGDDVKQAEFVGTGSEEETRAVDTVYETMYEYFLELVHQYGFDDYDSIFTKYFARLADVRRQVYGDEYMDTEFMFGAFEANVSAYGDSLTGTEVQLGDDGKTVLQEKSIGTYQTMFGEDYKFTTAVTDCTELSADEVQTYVAEYKERITPVAQSGETVADSFGITDTQDSTPKSDMASAYERLDCSEDITAVDKCTVTVTLEDGTAVATQELYVVQIGNSWYVDNTNVDTSALYLAR